MNRLIQVEEQLRRLSSRFCSPSSGFRTNQENSIRCNMKNTKLFRFLIVSRVLFVGLALSRVLAPQLHAATIIPVTNTFDSGSGSLRDALDMANNGDTIDATGVSGTIPVTTALVVAKNVTISGPGATRLTISGKRTTPVLKILNPEDPLQQGIVKISGVSIQFGNGTETGGGIFIGEGSSLRLENSNVSDNQSERGGGGIMNLGHLVLINCNVTRNTNAFEDSKNGRAAGGIVTGNASSSRLEKCNISQNRTNFGSGGILNRGFLDLIFCTVSKNTNGNGGTGTEIHLSGGITNEGSANISNSMIINNCGSRGGGIENLEGMGISGSTLKGNRAIQGGAIINHKVGGNYGGSPQNRAILSIDNSTITDNFAATSQDQNGQIAFTTKFCEDANPSTVQAVDWNGGAISNGAPLNNSNGTHRTFGSLRITSSTIGGVVETIGTTLVYHGNHALRGGGIENGDGGSTVILNSTISGNTAARGGGIYNTGPLAFAGGQLPVGSVSIGFSTITKNDVKTSNSLGDTTRGGGIDNGNKGQLILQTTILADNSASTTDLYSPDCFSPTDGFATSSGQNVLGLINENCNLRDQYGSGDLRFDKCGAIGEGLQNVCGTNTTFGQRLDPRLGVLQSNGGPTATHELMDTSPAKDFVAEHPFCDFEDQRGGSRPAGPACDTGAFELRAFPFPR
jgi:hypothetical protein